MGFAVANLASLSRQRHVRISPCSDSCATRPGDGVLGQNNADPKIAMSAGISVMVTTRATRTVRARPGPNARRKPSRATRRAAVPAVTNRPAVKMIGENSPVVRCAARTRRSPDSSRTRMPERKNTE